MKIYVLLSKCVGDGYFYVETYGTKSEAEEAAQKSNTLYTETIIVETELNEESASQRAAWKR